MDVDFFQTEENDEIISRGGASFMYERSIICFFDIIGWKQMINDNDAHRISAMLQILSVHDHMQRLMRDGYGVYYYQFSDSFVLISDPSQFSARKLLLCVQQIVEYLLEGGVLIRGSVSIGNVQHAHNLLVGPGLIRAYAEIESRLAIYPRIVIDPEIEEELCNFVGDGRFFHRDHDGLLLFDYVYLSAKRTLVFSHMEKLVRELHTRTNDLSARAKISWLIAQFERVSAMGITNRHDEQRASRSQH